MVSAEREGQAVVYMLADERIIQALDLLRASSGIICGAGASWLKPC